MTNIFDETYYACKDSLYKIIKYQSFIPQKHKSIKKTIENIPSLEKLKKEFFKNKQNKPIKTLIENNSFDSKVKMCKKYNQYDYKIIRFIREKFTCIVSSSKVQFSIVFTFTDKFSIHDIRHAYDESGGYDIDIPSYVFFITSDYSHTMPKAVLSQDIHKTYKIPLHCHLDIINKDFSAELIDKELHSDLLVKLGVLSVKHLPKIFYSDPLICMIGGSIGDIVKIHRPNIEYPNISEVTYRLII